MCDSVVVKEPLPVVTRYDSYPRIRIVGCALSSIVFLLSPLVGYSGTISYSTKLVIDSVYAEPDAGPLNSDNALLQIPTTQFGTELRPNLEVGFTPRLGFFLGPRFEVRDLRGESGGEDFEVTNIDARWSQLYLNYRVSKRVQVTYGIQNYKWGPSDWLGPSNVHSSDSGFESNLVYETDGSESVRVNADFGDSLALIVLVDTEDRLDGEQKATARLEFSSDSSAAYLGASISAAEDQASASGLYGSVELFSGLSVYTDALVSKARSRRVLSVQDSLPAFTPYDSRLAVNLFGLIGISYTLEGGQLFRVEYIHNSDGLDQTEWDQASETIKAFSPTGPLLLRDQQQSRFNLIGKEYLYFSSLFPDFGPQDRFRVSSRSLFSRQDQSHRHALNLESFLTDSSEVFVSTLVNFEGRSEISELGTDLEYGVSCGFIYSW